MSKLRPILEKLEGDWYGDPVPESIEKIKKAVIDIVEDHCAFLDDDQRWLVAEIIKENL